MASPTSADEVSTAAATDAAMAHTYRGIPFEDRLTPHPTLVSWLAHHARTRGGAPFLTTVADDGELTTLSYGEAELLSRRLARWLRAELQVAAGRTVALAPVNDPASIVAVLAVLRADCPLLLLGPQDPADRRRQQTEAAGAQVVLRPPSVPAEALPEAVVLPDPRTLEEPQDDLGGPEIDPDQDALFFATSGSTAASKLVAQSHYNAAVNAEALGRHHGLRPGDRLLGCLPVHHVNGLHFTVLGVLAAGAHVLLADGFDPLRYPRLLQRFRPRIASVVPSVLEALLETWRSPQLPDDFGYFVSAAAPLTTRTARAVWDRFGARVLQGYGLTETVNFSTTMPADLSEDAYRRLMLDTDIPSIGTALFGNEVAVLTPEGERAVPGQVGEICVRGHNVMSRYEANPAATGEAFAGGWFHTQDLGMEVTDPDRAEPFVVVTGRRKNIAKVGGETVSLDEMDRVLRAVPRVRDAACVALPHRFLGEEIVAAVVPAPGADGPPDVLPALAAAFRPAVLPRRVVPFDAIPRTRTGKVLRRELAERLAATARDGATDGRPHPAPAFPLPSPRSTP
ncbi:class I adenylate-forming enzyme family protein [Streptomyces melanosporofaciens]|uniref:Acyl-CoA synthetase (AMP-forming)/AMP-acid ligase II n=1 Tax=Streptomyces melanosporofaciens TaxID=67327 RepID=A0A1H5A2X3_STRMJ|nr:class I adenylate-forming enzyme family protein [Streptomyces melanosporofaciens]SED36689.1 Acyl-CoA synthetase (AMP-forming)/AMP-acid ligase II [Streptomyces melanosporofaciens]